MHRGGHFGVQPDGYGERAGGGARHRRHAHAVPQDAPGGPAASRPY